VEYRTLLDTQADTDAFENYSRDLPSVYLPQFKDLMQQSAAQAEIATTRHMDTGDFSGDAVIQTSPTGKYGVVFFSFFWTDFARTGNDLLIGDAFAGGMYLAKDNTLIIRYPYGYTVKSADPAPDEVCDGLIWYGLRSFGVGEPRISLEKPAFPLLPAAAGLSIIIIAVAGFFIYRTKKRQKEPAEQKTEEPPLSATEMVNLEERVIQLLRTQGGEAFQSEIVRNMGLPKSTVSAALNELHRRGVIQKVKKGRENLIRLS